MIIVLWVKINDTLVKVIILTYIRGIWPNITNTYNKKKILLLLLLRDFRVNIYSEVLFVQNIPDVNIDNVDDPDNVIVGSWILSLFITGKKLLLKRSSSWSITAPWFLMAADIIEGGATGVNALDDDREPLSVGGCGKGPNSSRPWWPGSRAISPGE